VFDGPPQWSVNKRIMFNSHKILGSVHTAVNQIKMSISITGTEPVEDIMGLIMEHHIY
jgi:hypothetical protein